ncbi:PaaX family transcriptional regulator C-terminal domain-containing protein [Kribbella sp. NPDC059898]|uniref:PaaX family transcriptional regulator n=1 Tax=Kribbella sp. NPDC059898 TaxID=3346995 RepID=UPI0036648D2A
MTSADPIESPLPRASARSYLLTVLGEFTYPDGAAWTTVLLKVLGGLGVEEHAARQAIARSAAAGWIESERQGRAVRWRLTNAGRAVVEEGQRRSEEFISAPVSWDGRWLILLVSLPQNERTTRKRLYGGLTWLRMGNPTPGLWLTPHAESVDELRDLITRFELTDTAICFSGRTEDVGLTDAQIVRRAWDLTELADHYRNFLEQYGGHRPAGGDDVLLRHIELRNLLQRFLRLDPQLPEQLLPNWVGREAAELFRTRRDQWSTAAHTRWNDLLNA